MRKHGLSIAAFAFFLLALIGQSFAGQRSHNQDQRNHGGKETSYLEYIRSDHFGEAVFENWESEFLQMAMFIFLTAFLVQKGSAESHKPPGERGAGNEPVSEDPRKHRRARGAPWPVRRGGIALRIYEHSLSLALFLLFAASMLLHARTGAAAYSADELAHGGQPVSTFGYMSTARFWFESLQNWQSEFLAVLSIVLLSIFLRERGSPESKPVHAPHWRTGE